MVPQMVRAARERLSTVLLAPLPASVDAAVLRGAARGRAVDLATAPPGLAAVPGDQGLPVLGRTLEYIRYGSDFTRARHAHYGPVSWAGFLGERVVMAAGPDATRAVLTNADKAYSQDGWRYLIDRFFGRGLMLLDFDEHRAHRRVMQQAFTADRLAGYVDQTIPCARDTVPTWPTDRPVRIYPELKRLTLDVATRVFMDERTGPETERINRAFVDCVRAASALVKWDVPGTRWRAGLRGRAVLETYFAENLPGKRAQPGHDLFSALCQARTPDGEAFSDTDVINHMIFLMMAAHDTSTITSAAAAYYLAANPQWQERAREESLALGDAPLDMAALRTLRTLDLVVKESLRLVAPVPVVMRRTVTDTALLGHHIPRGTLVLVAGAVNHFDPGCWTDPDTFDPDRFAEPRHEDRSHRDAWIPFGGGVHKCIGMAFGTLEVTAILHEMLRTYRWSVEPGYRPRWDNTSLPVPADGLPVRLTRLAA
ncbi:cytochrome P450 [Pseudonocardia petroleophila]|uniref:Cytochrome P450 n=1 Tax=Pseudonocardia petroleophila TaxID=37331 RepID=A0A7G7MSC7_9PSEU|nr:cytochrome P450 [Pseudonocardia petroleophila]QNG55688.1 cytochrome P450 [Pseudonocardia petroleophila]